MLVDNAHAVGDISFRSDKVFVVAEMIHDPSLCVVRLGKGERVSHELQALLNPVDPGSFHQYRLPANSHVELHFHAIDEYWFFIEGYPTVTLRSPSGMIRQYQLEPGDLVACVRGVEHTLWADHELVYLQYCSAARGGERPGHLTR